MNTCSCNPQDDHDRWKCWSGRCNGTRTDGEVMKTKGLSLSEAHASGRNYRRTFYVRKGETSFYRHSIAGNMLVDDAVATDYELEPQAKPLTREEVEEAFEEAASRNDRDSAKAALIEKLFGSEENV